MYPTAMENAMSTNVVMDIVLSHLKVRDLLNCRIVSKFWNEAASLVLRKRSTMIKQISTTKSLMELEKCMKQNSDFPFAGFIFNHTWMFSCPRVKKFFKNYGDKFTRLALGASKKTRIQDLVPFLNHLRRLSILEMHWPPQRAESLDSAAGQEGGRILKLPLLRTLRVSSELNQDGLGKVVKAASPSLRIECLEPTYGLLRQLKSFGKLQAVSVLKTEMKFCREDQGEDDAFRVAELFSSESPALTNLVLGSPNFISLDGLQKILISSQHTLKELDLNEIYPSEFLSECPVLTNLTKLSLHIDDEHDEYLFQGSYGHKFPALQELEIADEFIEANLSDGLFMVPSLKRIVLRSYFINSRIEDLARSFPNVIEIKLFHYRYDDFQYNEDAGPVDIWCVGAFKFLEKLKIWDCSVMWPTKNYDDPAIPINIQKYQVMNMDSFLTGIPITICEKLRKHNQQNLKDSPFHEYLRDSPNILQLQNLKELTISVDLGFSVKWDEVPEKLPFISMVSVWYALQMMPNLKARFVYEPELLSKNVGEEDFDKAVAVLKAAFRHVHPHVELEPFFD